MGYDERHQSSSSGAIVAIVVAGLIFAILAILGVGAGLFWVRTDVVQMQAVANEQRVVTGVQLTEVQGTQAEAQRPVTHVRIKDGMVQIQQSSVAAAPDPRLRFEVEINSEGNASVDGEDIGLDELRAQLAKLKDETSNTFSVRINADSECPVKHVIPVLDVCEEVGDVDYRVVSSKGSDESAVESDTAN